MDLRNLKTFVEVAELGSFTKAAERLGYSQPAVSFQVHQLEEELNTSLFDRINHMIMLTSQGQKVLASAYEILRQVQEMEENVHQEPEIRGKVRIAMADSLCSWLLASQYSALRKEHPGISLQIITTHTEETLQLLDQNQVDLAYILDRHVYHRNYVIAQEECIGSHFVAASDNPLASSGPLSPAQVVEQPCILTECGMSYRTLLEHQLARYSLEIDPILELGNTDLICSLVASGRGISFLPDYVTEQAVNEGKLVRLEVQGLSIEIWKQLLHHRSKYLSPAIRTVMSYLF